jgi:ankyrin repeat protein
LEAAIASGESIKDFENHLGISLISEFIRLSRSRDEDVPLGRLLKLGANVNSPSMHGVSPLMSVLLHYSSDKFNHTEMLVSLLRAGADTEAHSIMELVEAGWKVQHQFSRLYPLGLAVQLGNVAAVEILLLGRANPEGPTDPDVIKPLSIAAMWKEENLTEVLLSAGAKVNAKNNDGRTALHYCWDEKTGKILVSAGACLDLLDNKGRLPLHEWCERASSEACIQWLADLNLSHRFKKDPLGFSPLDLLKQRSEKDKTNQYWLLPLISSWEYDFIEGQTPHVASEDATLRRL